MKMVDAFLSRKLQAAWPCAVVYKLDSERFIVERGEAEDDLDIGGKFLEAKSSVEAIVNSKVSSSLQIAGPSQLEKKPNRYLVRYSRLSNGVGSSPEIEVVRVYAHTAQDAKFQVELADYEKITRVEYVAPDLGDKCNCLNKIYCHCGTKI